MGVLIWQFGGSKISKLKTAKLKFSGGHNVIAVVATDLALNGSFAKYYTPVIRYVQVYTLRENSKMVPPLSLLLN